MGSWTLAPQPENWIAREYPQASCLIVQKGWFLNCWEIISILKGVLNSSDVTTNQPNLTTWLRTLSLFSAGSPLPLSFSLCCFICLPLPFPLSPFIQHACVFSSSVLSDCLTPLSRGFSRQEYCSGLPFSAPGCLPNPRIEPWSPVVVAVQLLSCVRHFPCRMDCSLPGFPVCHHLLEFAQTHVHQVSDAIQPPCPLSSPSLPVFNLSQHQGLFQRVGSSHQVAKVLELQLQHQSFQ